MVVVLGMVVRVGGEATDIPAPVPPPHPRRGKGSVNAAESRAQGLWTP